MTEEKIIQPLRPILSAATRSASEARQLLTLDTENFQRLAESQQAIRISEKLDRILKLIASQCKYPGGNAEVHADVNYPLVAGQDASELLEYCNELEKRSLIEVVAQGGTVLFCKPTIAGWQALEPSLQLGGMPGTCFIAMWFDPSMNEAFEQGFDPAVRDSGFKPVRIDRVEHNNAITDEIMAGIRGAEFTVADFTGHRAGVYYEAGFARGLGRHVVYCCREDSFNERHFDTSVINHVVWKNPAELRKKLGDRIKATILPNA